MRTLDKTDIWHNLCVMVCSSPKENSILTRVFSVGRVCVCVIGRNYSADSFVLSLSSIFKTSWLLTVIRLIWSWAYAD